MTKVKGPLPTPITSVAKVSASDVAWREIPQLPDGSYVLALGTDTIFELENGGVSIAFIVDIKLVRTDVKQDELEKLKEMIRTINLDRQAFSVLHVKVTTEFGVLSDGVGLSVEAISKLGREWFRQLVTEAFATTRGYVSALLANTKLASFTMPISEPDVFLGGDFGKMIDSGTLPKS